MAVLPFSRSQVGTALGYLTLEYFWFCLFIYIVGVQSKSPQDVPLWCADSFELKATVASGSRKTSALPLTT